MTEVTCYVSSGALLTRLIYECCDVCGLDETGQMVLMTGRENHSHEILGLLKFTNYSVQVLAQTQVGDGVASTPIYVQTRNDCTCITLRLECTFEARIQIFCSTHSPPA